MTNNVILFNNDNINYNIEEEDIQSFSIENYFKNPSIDYLKLCDVKINPISYQNDYSFHKHIPSIHNLDTLHQKLLENIFCISTENIKNAKNSILLLNDSFILKNEKSFLSIEFNDLMMFSITTTQYKADLDITFIFDLKNNRLNFSIIIPFNLIINNKECIFEYNIQSLREYLNNTLYEHFSKQKQLKQYKNNI